MADTFVDTEEQDGGVARGEKLKFEDFGGEVVESSFCFFHVVWLFDDDHTVWVIAVVSEGKDDFFFITPALRAPPIRGSKNRNFRCFISLRGERER